MTNHPSRELAAVDLIESLRTRYPTKGFKIHPSISFVSMDDGGGIGAIALDDIPKDEVLIVIPQSSRCAVDRVITTRKTAEKVIGEIIHDIQRQCRNNIPRYANTVSPDDISLAVAVMHILSQKDCNPSNDPYVLQALTWPSPEEMKDSSMFYWDKNKIRHVWNQSLLTHLFMLMRNNLDYVVDEVIVPTIVKAKAEASFVDSTISRDASTISDDPKDAFVAIRSTFTYAFSLVWSRAHGSSQPELIPLVEMINGNSSRHDETSINVKLVSGKWPFLYGSTFRDDCNLNCSGLHATKYIKKGEQLIIDYGEMNCSSFAYKYGTVPTNVLSHHDMQVDVALYCDPNLIDVADNPLRVKCLRKNGYPIEDLRTQKNCICTLDSNGSLERYMQGCEDSMMGSARQMLILSMLAGPEELQRNIDTGLLRGRLYTDRVTPLMCQLIDYNIEQLAPGTAVTSGDDMERANKATTPVWEKAALLARVAYRESLVRWRHAICLRNGSAAYLSHPFNAKQPNDQNMISALMNGGCGLCGRTYPLLKCSRCKQTQYCGRHHQKQHWKHHKPNCHSAAQSGT